MAYFAYDLRSSWRCGRGLIIEVDAYLTALGFSVIRVLSYSSILVNEGSKVRQFDHSVYTPKAFPVNAVFGPRYATVGTSQ